MSIPVKNTLPPFLAAGQFSPLHMPVAQAPIKTLEKELANFDPPAEFPVSGPLASLVVLSEKALESLRTPPSIPSAVLPPMRRRRSGVAVAQAAHYKKNLTGLFLKKEPRVSVEAGIESVRQIIDHIPFDFLKASVSPHMAPAMELFVRQQLPRLIQLVALGSAGRKVTIKDPVLGTCCIRCDSMVGSKEYEIYVRRFVANGGVKHIDQQIFLSGPHRGKVFAYAKPISDPHQELHRKELLREVAIGKLFRPDASLIVMQGVMKRCHPGILKGGWMPWCDRGDLDAYVKKPFEEANRHERLQIIRDVASGMKCLHESKFCHMDLKPGNVLLQTGEHGLTACVCDFGRACPMGTQLRIPVSTRLYMAPEQLSQNKFVSPSMDMWNVGLILLELMHGTEANLYLDSAARVFEESHFRVPDMFSAIRAHWTILRDRIVQKLDPASLVDQLIARLLSVEPASRPTAAQVVEEVDRIMGAKS